MTADRLVNGAATSDAPVQAKIVTWSVTISAGLTLTSAEPRPCPNSQNQRMYRPERLSVALIRRDGGPWRQGQVTLFGPKLRRNGSPSVTQCQESFYRRDIDEWPTWLVGLVEALGWRDGWLAAELGRCDAEQQA